MAASAATAAHHRAHLPCDFLEPTEGFNLFYGSGSKRRVLNDITRACAMPSAHITGAHVLILNGFLLSSLARNIFAVLARLPGSPQSVEAVAQTRRVGSCWRLLLLLLPQCPL